jgi:oxalate decarboxylase/phosphoglucose isomerase-like protein (cupin superfamily)
MSERERGGYVVQESDLPWQELTKPELRARSSIRWKTLLGEGGTPTSKVTFGLAEIPAGGTWVLHHHAPPEVYYVLAGEGSTEIDGVVHDVRAGSVIYIPGNAQHLTINTGTEPLRFAYAFPTDTIEEIEYHFADHNSGPTRL